MGTIGRDGLGRFQHWRTLMQLLKLGLYNRSALELLTICEQHTSNINRLPANLRSEVRLAELNDTAAAARSSFDEVQSLRMSLKEAITRRNQQLRAFRQQTTYACGLVAVNANGDPGAVPGAGLPLKSGKHPVGVPGVPMSFTAAPGDNEGEVKLKWKRPLRRCTFMIQIRAENETAWRNHETSVATRSVITDLTSGVKYWFRLCAVNAHGKGPWSQPLSARAK